MDQKNNNSRSFLLKTDDGDLLALSGKLPSGFGNVQYRIATKDNTAWQDGTTIRDNGSGNGTNDLLYRQPYYPSYPWYSWPITQTIPDYETRRAALDTERTTKELQAQLVELRGEIIKLQEAVQRASGVTVQEKAALDLLLAAGTERPEEYARIVKAVKILLGTE